MIHKKTITHNIVLLIFIMSYKVKKISNEQLYYIYIYGIGDVIHVLVLYHWMKVIINQLFDQRCLFYRCFIIVFFHLFSHSGKYVMFKSLAIYFHPHGLTPLNK